MPAPFVPPAGVSPISAFFTGLEFAEPGEPPVILADAIDPVTGEFLSLERGFDPTDAAFLLAMTTVRGSGSAVEQVGQRFGDATHVSPQLESFMREETRLAVKPIVDRGDLELGTVAVTDNGNGSVELYVEWANIARDKEQKARLPLNLLVGAAP